MRPHFPVASFVLISSLAFAQVAPDLANLKQQFEAQSAVALKPVVTRYAAQLESARRAVLQRGDAAGATAAEDALNEIRTKITIPAPNVVPAVPPPAVGGTGASTETLGELRKRLGGTKWKGDDGGEMTFGADSFVTSSWGTRGEWKLITPRRMTVEWGRGQKEEMTVEPGLKTFSRGNGIKWHLKE
jgi:hypothetical protein